MPQNSHAIAIRAGTDVSSQCRPHGLRIDGLSRHPCRPERICRALSRCNGAIFTVLGHCALLSHSYDMIGKGDYFGQRRISWTYMGGSSLGNTDKKIRLILLLRHMTEHSVSPVLLFPWCSSHRTVLINYSDRPPKASVVSCWWTAKLSVIRDND